MWLPVKPLQTRINPSVSGVNGSQITNLAGRDAYFTGVWMRHIPSVEWFRVVELAALCLFRNNHFGWSFDKKFILAGNFFENVVCDMPTFFSAPMCRYDVKPLTAICSNHPFDYVYTQITCYVYGTSRWNVALESILQQVACYRVVGQGSRWAWVQPMRGAVTLSLIGWAHTQNDPCWRYGRYIDVLVQDCTPLLRYRRQPWWRR